MAVTSQLVTLATTLKESNGHHDTFDEPALEMEMSQGRAMMAAVRTMLIQIGEDPDREGLRQTPYRIAKAWLTELFAGYHEDPGEYMTDFDSEGYDELVIVKDIGFVSFCEHHALPFIGKTHVGYVPDGRIVGLSKIPRLVQTYAKRLQVQERMTAQIANTIEEYLKPRGVIVVIEAAHSCMIARGIKAVGSLTMTSAVRGVFADPARGARQEFLDLLRS